MSLSLKESEHIPNNSKKRSLYYNHLLQKQKDLSVFAES